MALKLVNDLRLPQRVKLLNGYDRLHQISYTIEFGERWREYAAQTPKIYSTTHLNRAAR